jgi:hypothetical protein
MSQQVWNDKDPSLLKGPERQSAKNRPEFFSPLPFTGNGDVSVFK